VFFSTEMEFDKIDFPGKHFLIISVLANLILYNCKIFLKRKYAKEFKKSFHLNK
jgi:hypothetical protein